MTDLVWLFGYGSLMWRCDFPYRDARRAYVDGWTRRFWQDTHDHRGGESDSGPTVTLVDAPGEQCYGRVLLVETRILEAVDELQRNGFERYSIDIHFDVGHIAGIVDIATPANRAIFGEAPVEELAAQISGRGRCGTNAEYLFRLARALRELGISDPHVFELEGLVRAKCDEVTS